MLTRTSLRRSRRCNRGDCKLVILRVITHDDTSSIFRGYLVAMKAMKVLGTSVLSIRIWCTSDVNVRPDLDRVIALRSLRLITVAFLSELFLTHRWWLLSSTALLHILGLAFRRDLIQAVHVWWMHGRALVLVSLLLVMHRWHGARCNSTLRPVEKQVVWHIVWFGLRRGYHMATRWRIDNNRLAPVNIDLQSRLFLSSLLMEKDIHR